MLFAFSPFFCFFFNPQFLTIPLTVSPLRFSTPSFCHLAGKSHHQSLTKRNADGRAGPPLTTPPLSVCGPGRLCHGRGAGVQRRAREGDHCLGGGGRGVGEWGWGAVGFSSWTQSGHADGGKLLKMPLFSSFLDPYLGVFGTPGFFSEFLCRRLIPILMLLTLSLGGGGWGAQGG